jgi:hypothetical protein
MKHISIFLLFVCLQFLSVAQVIKADELITLSSSTDKELKKILLERGYRVDPLSGLTSTYHTSMPGPPKKYTSPFRYIEFSSDSCSYTAIEKTAGIHIQYQTSDTTRLKQLSKEFYALGFLKFTPQGNNIHPRLSAYQHYFILSDTSTLYPTIKVRLDYRMLTNRCNKQTPYYTIEVFTFIDKY